MLKGNVSHAEVELRFLSISLLNSSARGCIDASNFILQISKGNTSPIRQNSSIWVNTAKFYAVIPFPSDGAGSAEKLQPCLPNSNSTFNHMWLEAAAGP